MTNLAILLCVYSGDDVRFLTQCLESLEHQVGCRPDLYINIDGEIDERLGSLISSWGKRDWVYVKSRKVNLGLAASLNELIDLALENKRYEFLARMDSDDIAFSDRFLKQLEFFRENPEVDVLGGSCVEIDINNKPVMLKVMETDDAWLKKNLIRRTPFIHPTVMFRRRVFESGIRYRTDTHLSEDTFLWVDLARAGFYFANLTDLLIYYRVTNELFQRRSGWKKAVSEAKARIQSIKSQKGVSVVDVFWVFSYFLLRVSPQGVIRFMYRVFRGYTG